MDKGSQGQGFLRIAIVVNTYTCFYNIYDHSYIKAYWLIYLPGVCLSVDGDADDDDEDVDDDVSDDDKYSRELISFAIYLIVFYIVLRTCVG